jgi:hypothetical protein
LNVIEIAPVTMPRGQLEEYAVHRFSACASDLGWLPGYRPAQLHVHGLGNGQPFLLTPDSTDQCWIYFQVLGCTYIRIYND